MGDFFEDWGTPSTSQEVNSPTSSFTYVPAGRDYAYAGSGEKRGVMIAAAVFACLMFLFMVISQIMCPLWKQGGLTYSMFMGYGGVSVTFLILNVIGSMLCFVTWLLFAIGVTGKSRAFCILMCIFYPTFFSMSNLMRTSGLFLRANFFGLNLSTVKGLMFYYVVILCVTAPLLLVAVKREGSFHENRVGKVFCAVHLVAYLFTMFTPLVNNAGYVSFTVFCSVLALGATVTLAVDLVLKAGGDGADSSGSVLPETVPAAATLPVTDSKPVEDDFFGYSGNTERPLKADDVSDQPEEGMREEKQDNSGADDDDLFAGM